MAKTNFTETSISPAALKQVGFALNEIAQIAKVINQNSVQSIQEMNEDDTRALESLILSTGYLASQVGYIADLCADKVGAGFLCDGAEEWLLPPAYNDITNQTKGVAA